MSLLPNDLTASDLTASDLTASDLTANDPGPNTDWSKAASSPIDFLMSLPKFGSGTGLHRMQWLYDRLRSDLSVPRFDAVKITGSNGKGSVSAMLASILTALEQPCGLYTSPHLLRFHERIRWRGEPIADAALNEAVAWFSIARLAYQAEFPADTIGAFEAFTSIALYHFARQGAETLVVEAGIGGRYDSTRLIPGALTALTSLDLEHRELLGGSLELIAYDKADLCPEGGELLVGEIDPELLRRLYAYCRIRGVRLVPVTEHSRVFEVTWYADRMVFDGEFDGIPIQGLELRLLGPHQVSNARTAVLCALRWARIHAPRLSTGTLIEGIRRGLVNTLWPGRFERIHADPDVFIDVGHSPAAIDALVETIRRRLGARPLLLVTGVSHNKDIPGILSRLAPLASEAICTRAYHMGAPVATIAGVLKERRPELPVRCAGTIEEAMTLALERAQESGMAVLAAGGLFLAVEAQQALRGVDPRTLRFF